MSDLNLLRKLAGLPLQEIKWTDQSDIEPSEKMKKMFDSINSADHWSPAEVIEFVKSAFSNGFADGVNSVKR